MAKTNDYIGFRPGDLLTDIKMRADAKGQARYVKTALGNHFALLEVYGPKMRETFTPNECRYMFLAYDGHDIDIDTLVHRIVNLLKKDDNVAEISTSLKVDSRVLISKINAAESVVLYALVDGLIKLKTLFFNGERHFRSNGLPTDAALRRCGLMRVSGPVAWGYCNVVCANNQSIDYVLRDHVDDVIPANLEEIDQIDLTRSLIEFTKDCLAGFISAQDLRGHQLAYRIAHAKNLQRFYVREEIDQDPIVVELKPHELNDDFRTGDIEQIWLAGVNAPDKQRSRSPS